MDTDKSFIEGRAKESKGENFIRTLLKLSGYRVMSFGIENHNMGIIKSIKTNYDSKNNRRLLSMPDLVVLDDEKRESWFIEIKHRSFNKFFNMKSSNLALGYRKMKDYLDFWGEGTIIFTMNVEPYCVCVDLKDVNWNIHLKEKRELSPGNMMELWNFCGIYKKISEKFPMVNKENFSKALMLSGIK